MGKTFNKPLTLEDVKNSATHTMLSFEEMVRIEMPSFNVLFDNELTYTSALQEVFKRSSYDAINYKPLPLFAYNRTVLKKTESAMGRRFSSQFGNVKLLDGSLVQYTMTNSEFDINFIAITEDMQTLEQFEVAYNSNDGISGSREITVDIPDIGVFKYFITYNDMESKEIIFEESYYKTIIGSATIRGFYFLFNASGKQISEINTRIIKSNDLLLKSQDEILSNIQNI